MKPCGVGALDSPLRPSADNLPLDYQLDLLNADCDLERLRVGLGRAGEGRLCLYGPPGTGKTAFGHHIAQTLDRPMLVKRASDNRRFGHGAVTVASAQQQRRNQQHAGKQQRRSPRYTTRLEEVVTVRA